MKNKAKVIKKISLQNSMESSTNLKNKIGSIKRHSKTSDDKSNEKSNEKSNVK